MNASTPASRAWRARPAAAASPASSAATTAASNSARCSTSRRRSLPLRSIPPRSGSPECAVGYLPTGWLRRSEPGRSCTLSKSGTTPPSIDRTVSGIARPIAEGAPRAGRSNPAASSGRVASLAVTTRSGVAASATACSRSRGVRRPIVHAITSATERRRRRRRWVARSSRERSRPSISATLICRARVAAISMERGTPSSWRHTFSTVSASSSWPRWPPSSPPRHASNS